MKVSPGILASNIICITKLNIIGLCFFMLPAYAYSDENLVPLLDGPLTIISLDPLTKYFTTGEVAIRINKTLYCNGASIETVGGPIHAWVPGVTLTADNCDIQGSGWALLGARDGAEMVVKNGTRLTGNGANSCIRLDRSILSMTGTIINNCMWGVNMQNSNASMHGVSILNTLYGVQNVAGNLIIDGGSYLENINPENPGIGISLIGSASLPTTSSTGLIDKTTFVGFSNAVDIQPTAEEGLAPGTVTINNSIFKDQYGSALCAVDAEKIKFSNSQVLNAATDGLYFVNSTGEVDNSKIQGSLNTGVTFWGCPRGFTIRNSLLSQSAHQGIGIVYDDINNRESHSVVVLDNTFKDNVIADILVDDTSDAYLQGNIFSYAISPSLKLYGTPLIDMIGNFIFHGGEIGIEARNGANAHGSLLYVVDNGSDGMFIYDNASVSIANSVIGPNGQYSVSLNTGAKFDLEFSTIGPAGSIGLWNTAGNTANVVNNFWSDELGPYVPEYLNPPTSGGGATIEWDYTNSYVNFMPFLSSTPIKSNHTETFRLVAGGYNSWTTEVGITLELNGANDISEITDGIMAVIRILDASQVRTPLPPAGTVRDGLVAVWVEYDLLAQASSGSIRIRSDLASSTATLYQLRQQCWTPLSTYWDAINREWVFSTTDTKLLNGVFALKEPHPESDDLQIKNQEINHSVIYTAYGSITADTFIVKNPSGNLTLQAGEQINLLPGFIVESGGQLRASIVQCIK